MSAEDWIATLDEKSGSYYYYNVETGETSWDPPEGGVANAGGVFDHGREGGGDAAAMAAISGAAEEEENWSPWAEEVDENGNVYYANVLTGESSWKDPEAKEGGATAGTADYGSKAQDWTEQYDGEGNVCEFEIDR